MERISGLIHCSAPLRRRVTVDQPHMGPETPCQL